MNIPECYEITIVPDDCGKLSVRKDGELIYIACGINNRRATHWNYLETPEDEKFVTDLLNALTECTNYQGCSDDKHERQAE